jgi:nucleotide-binding universal stress UspA family protein/predicted Ser/Thr protein kinase
MTPSLRIAPGTMIDGFTVGELLHGGGMALIYHADRPNVGFPLVMKVPRFGHGEPGTSVVSHEIERQMLETLKGQHLPRLVAAGDLERLPYLAMEFIEGPTLEHWVARAPVAPNEVVWLGIAIATAAHRLHMQEAIHLDLKPDNIIIRPGGEAVLIDFGLAHHTQFPDLLAEEFRRPIGSAPYIAPEQVFSVRCDPRSDIFAIGVILYELATGRLPYGMPSSPRGLRARCYQDPVPPRALAPAVPEWLQEVILRCLEPDARQRYTSAGQLAFDLGHSQQVAITERGRRLERTGWRTRFVRWVRMAGYEPAPCPPPSTQVAGASIVLVAVAPGPESDPSNRLLAEMTRRVISGRDEFRVVCATVIRPLPQWGTSDPNQTAPRERLRHLVELKQWARALALPQERITFHVLEANDPATALLDYAQAHQVDHIIVGAPPIRKNSDGRSGRARLGSVATRVVTEAPCHVTVVKPRSAQEAP